MKELFRTLPLMCAVLLIPVLPFLFFGGQLEQWVQQFVEEPPAASVTALLVIVILATDIFLPVPSSVICTLSGWQLGWWLGTLASWLGMTVGAVIGFALARRYGHAFAAWFSKADDLQRMRWTIGRYGPVVLVLTRAMPVFAEASVLIAGIHKLSWSRFLPAVILSNVGIALAYGAFGHYAQQYQWLPLALSVAVAIPVLIAAAAHRLLPSAEAAGTSDVETTDPATSTPTADGQTTADGETMAS